jgi:hypothetical protein
MMLSALTYFATLHERYTKNPNCRKPAMSASLATAWMMGKGPYFVQQICKTEPYMLKHRCLPIPKLSTNWHTFATLLDNEGILQKVWDYLVGAKVGLVSQEVHYGSLFKSNLPIIEGYPDQLCQTCQLSHITCI